MEGMSFQLNEPPAGTPSGPVKVLVPQRPMSLLVGWPGELRRTISSRCWPAGPAPMFVTTACTLSALFGSDRLTMLGLALIELTVRSGGALTISVIGLAVHAKLLS